MVPRIVFRALCGTSGITSSIADVGGSGCGSTAGATIVGRAAVEFVVVVWVAGVGDGGLVAAAGGGRSTLKVRITNQPSRAASAAIIITSALLLERTRAGRGGGCCGSLTRITSRVVDGATNWD